AARRLPRRVADVVEARGRGDPRRDHVRRPRLLAERGVGPVGAGEDPDEEPVAGRVVGGPLGVLERHAVGGDQPPAARGGGPGGRGDGEDGGQRGREGGEATAATHYADCAVSACRIVLGSMKRTSSWTTWNSSKSSVQRERKKSTRRCTTSSIALASVVNPT